MQEFIGAMVRLSTALTIYGIQQVRHGVSELASTPMSMDRVREAMDSATNSIRSKIDDSQKTTFNSVTTFGEDVLAKTCDTLRRSAETAGAGFQRTGPEPEEPEPVRRHARRGSSKAGSGEPQPAADVL